MYVLVCVCMYVYILSNSDVFPQSLSRVSLYILLELISLYFSVLSLDSKTTQTNKQKKKALES